MLKTFVLVRGDLPRQQQAVQAGHALAELAFAAGQNNDETYEKWINQDKTLIILKVRGLEELLKHRNDLLTKRITHNMFYEPDIDQETALAVWPTEEDWFKELPLV